MGVYFLFLFITEANLYEDISELFYSPTVVFQLVNLSDILNFLRGLILAHFAYIFHLLTNIYKKILKKNLCMEIFRISHREFVVFDVHDVDVVFKINNEENVSS